MGILMSMFSFNINDEIKNVKEGSTFPSSSNSKYLLETLNLIESITSEVTSLKSSIMSKGADFMKRLSGMEDDYADIMNKYRQEYKEIKTGRDKLQLHTKLTMEISGLERIKKALDEYADDVKFKNNDNYKKLTNKVTSMIQSFETLQSQTEEKRVSS